MTGDADPMAALVAALPAQLSATRRRLAGWSLPGGPHRPPHAVAVCGMGGWAIAADIVVGALANRASVPIAVVRGPQLPAWVGAETLVVASSHSGATAETRSAWENARGRGARIVVVTAGEAWAAEARASGAAVIEIPAGGPPRAALGHGIAAILAVLEAAGVIQPGCDAGAAAAAQAVLAGDVGGAPSPAVLADALVERVPLVYANEALAAVARRWKGQINENAKTLAVTDTLPEMFHNTVVGFGHPAWLPAQVVAVFLGAQPDAVGSAFGSAFGSVDAPDALERHGTAATLALLRGRGIPAFQITAPHPPGLAAALWLVAYGDVLSLALAERYGEAPTPIAAIDELKRRVREAGPESR